VDITIRPDLILFEPIARRLKLSPYHKGILSRLNIFTVKDLLFHLPNSVQARRFFQTIQELKAFYSDPKNLSIKAGCVGEVVVHETSKVNHIPTRVVVKDATGGMEIVFFHIKPSYLQTKLPVGRRFAFGGFINTYLGRIHMVQPDIISDPAQKHTLEGNDRIYGLTKGLSQNFFRNVMPSLIETLPEIPEWDEATVKEQNWPSWTSALTSLHCADSDMDLAPTTPSRQRLAYDEFLAHQVSMMLLKQAYRRAAGIPKTASGTLIQKALSLIPFKLTNAQVMALNQTLDDLKGTHQMHRLIQGDVGSGKTIVAVLAMLKTVESGFQATLLAPTDILARQHFATIKPLCDQLGVEIRLFTGRDKVKERRINNEDLQSGKIQIAVGTHALIQEKLQFQNLGLAVVDEQHKFGVVQRAALSEKGQFIDTLFMSATPIPRTIVLSRYGDLDLSIIGEKPPGRKDIKTLVMPDTKESELIKSLDRSINTGNQIYWVCPLIEESDVLDLTASEDRYQHLCEALPHRRIGMVHGRMKGPEKDAVMAEFKLGNLDILVATTVIEVGVDVPKATVMVIEHAERFGLAQLHQLRGRIGRNDQESTCILLYAPNPTEIAQARLKIMRETNDGFKIAEEDLTLRGGGEVASTRQSGFPDYIFGDPFEHRQLMELAYHKAYHLLKENPDLSGLHGDVVRLLLKLYNRDDTLRYVRSG
jgi:ATP-dependent DNA helicase RecG